MIVIVSIYINKYEGERIFRHSDMEWGPLTPIFLKPILSSETPYDLRPT